MNEMREKLGLMAYAGMELNVKGVIVKKMNLGLMSIGLALTPIFSFAVVNSGSTGTDGAFSPTVNTEVVLPPSGILNYTTVNIPTGVTVTFKKNATNTPVVVLASGNVTIAGAINLNGTDGKPTGAAGDGVLGDDGIPGVGGPGGYDGGRGGAVGRFEGGAGLGPGGGGGGRASSYNGSFSYGGAGGSFGAVGSYSYTNSAWYNNPAPGATYGTSQLLPLIGGSGGGGGFGGAIFTATGGSGGGGALLIVSNGTVNLTGAINANGGNGVLSGGTGCGGGGGGGSGGAIRIVATMIQGNGAINANGGAASASCAGGGGAESSGAGGAGRIRLESDAITRTSATSPAFTFLNTTNTMPVIFVAGLPTLFITNIAGVAVPAQPTGNADVTLPSTTANPVNVVFTTTGVPAGNTIKLTLVPPSGAVTTVVSPALVGDTTSATASVNITLPNGPSTLQATVTYNIVLAMGEALSVYAQGERVEKITLASTLGSKESTVTLITVSGKEFVVPRAVLAAMPA